MSINAAAAAGDLERVKVLLEEGSDINRPMMMRRGGKTALALAVEKDRTEVVKYLLEMGADQSLARFSLHAAAARGNLEMSQAIVEAGVDLDELSNDGFSALHHAARHERSDIVEYLVQAGGNVNVKSSRGIRPLHEALASSPRMASLLIDLGANVRVSDNRGVSPFELACRIPSLKLAEKILSKIPARASARRQNMIDKGFREALAHNDLELERFLIENGANLQARAYGGYGLLHLASELGHADSIALLLGEGARVNFEGGKARWTPLHFASANGRLAAFNLLIEHGAKIEALDAMNRTPLHLAAERFHFDIVSKLLEQGADANIQDKDKNLPLHYAATTTDDKLIRLLAEHTTVLNTENASGDSPLAIAKRTGRAQTGSARARALTPKNISAPRPDFYPEVLRLLFKSMPAREQRIQREVIDRSLHNGDRLLNIAAGRGSLPAVRAILQADDTQFNARNRYGYLAIHAAADMGHIEVVKFLLSEGASVDDQENTAMWSPLHFAVSKGHLVVAEVLSDAGANAVATDGNGLTPIDLANFNQQEPMIALLRKETAQGQ